MDKKRSSLNRLKRIEGQVRGVAPMIEEDRYCIDVLTQIQAVKTCYFGLLRNRSPKNDELLTQHFNFSCP
jgi:DNA-binding FrmR family transcriptional regulator